MFKYIPVLIFCFFVFGCVGPKAMFTVEQDSDLVPTTIKLVNQSLRADRYLWDFGDGETSVEKDPSHRYIYSGRHMISLTASKKDKIHTFSQEIILNAPQTCFVEMVTTEGTMIIELYNETPLHRDNFLKLAESNYYNDLMFHRVIKGFMIQAGDPDSRNAPPQKRLGGGGPDYTIPAEIVSSYVHVKGALAAARQGDQVNPNKESSGSQFYIVDGRSISDQQLEAYEFEKGINYSDEDKSIFKNLGGAPQLDKEYTVFGRVIEGLEVIDLITNVSTDPADRPKQDVKILSVKLIK